MRDAEASATEEQLLTEAEMEAAAGGWFDCEITLVGPAADDNVYIGLRSLEGKWPGSRYYSAISTYKKEILATALTAIATSLHVSVYLMTTDPGGTVTRCYARRDI
jgi:hypothetical protein